MCTSSLRQSCPRLCTSCGTTGKRPYNGEAFLPSLWYLSWQAFIPVMQGALSPAAMLAIRLRLALAAAGLLRALASMPTAAFRRHGKRFCRAVIQASDVLALRAWCGFAGLPQMTVASSVSLATCVAVMTVRVCLPLSSVSVVRCGRTRAVPVRAEVSVSDDLRGVP